MDVTAGRRGVFYRALGSVGGAAVLAVLWAGHAWATSPAVLPVVTTSTDLKALVEAVGAERVRVESLAPPLQDPHAVEVKAGQLARLREAALLVRIGLDHEPWLARVLRSLGDPRFAPGTSHYLDTSKGLELLQAETPRVAPERGVHVHGFGNTHYWLDPANARPMTAAILEALARLAPEHRAALVASRDRFLAGLDAGLARWEAAMAPHRGTRVAAVHETWPYFARRFGLVVVASVEPTPGVPPSPSHLATLTRRMRESGVRLLLAEPYSNASVVSQVAARSGARVVTLVPSVGGDPAARDYLALFELNVRKVADALAR
jgi:ABC-type Zn uptake system ZnuABC Zn-binding protein ZnuA